MTCFRFGVFLLLCSLCFAVKRVADSDDDEGATCRDGWFVHESNYVDGSGATVARCFKKIPTGNKSSMLTSCEIDKICKAIDNHEDSYAAGIINFKEDVDFIAKNFETDKNPVYVGAHLKCGFPDHKAEQFVNADAHKLDPEFMTNCTLDNASGEEKLVVIRDKDKCDDHKEQDQSIDIICAYLMLVDTGEDPPTVPPGDDLATAGSHRDAAKPINAAVSTFSAFNRGCLVILAAFCVFFF